MPDSNGKQKWYDFAHRIGIWGAVVAILGAAAVPFVYMAADWWAGLHTERVTGPGASGSLESEMFLTLMFSLVTFIVLFAALVGERSAQLAVEQSIGEVRREAMDR